MNYSHDVEGKRCVEKFNLDNTENRNAYENIINSCRIIRDEFAYDRKTGSPVITVWYIEDDEDL